MTAPLDQHVVIFARQPKLGQVKTRLAATVGDARALEIYVALAERVVASLNEPDAWKLVVRCAPDVARGDVERWLGGAVAVAPQGDGDLGARMSRALTAHLEQGAARVVIVGTDCPDVGPEIVRQAFAALETNDLVYGPALDGGYYLVGARRPVPQVFVDVPWSAPDTLAVSLERAQSADLSVQLLEPLSDIDTEDDWRAWQARADGPAAQSASATEAGEEPRS